MRLYQLMERYGYVRIRGIPWFTAPVAGEPDVIPGWHWDAEAGEWIEDPLITAEVDLAPQPGPMPTRPPGPAIPNRVEGWEWSIATKKWWPMPMPTKEVWGYRDQPPMPDYIPKSIEQAQVVGWSYDFEFKIWFQTSMPLELIEVEKERPLAPEYPPGPEVPVRMPGWEWNRDEQEWMASLYATQVVEFEVPRGVLPGTEVTDEEFEIALAGPAEVAFNALRQIGMTPGEAGELLATWFVNIRNIRDVGAWNIWSLVAIKAKAMLQDFQQNQPHWFERPESAGLMYLILIALVAAILIAIIRIRSERISLKPPEQTFLLGPDYWKYGKHVGRSVKGKNYYSCCYEACPTTARHMRGPPWGVTDSIIFPDGFVEEGYYAGKFRKYAWEVWIIEYRGFLVRINDGLFMLKERDLPEGAPPFIVFMRPEDQWCTDFLYYL